MAHRLIGSWLLMLRNRSQSFIKSSSATDKGGCMDVFVGRTILSSVFGREFVSVFNAIKAWIFSLEWSKNIIV